MPRGLMRYLKDIRISEVSGVDKGAGVGTRIVMLKCDEVDEVTVRKTADALLSIWLGKYQKDNKVSLSKAYDAAIADRQARVWWDTVKGGPDPAGTVMPNITGAMRKVAGTSGNDDQAPDKLWTAPSKQFDREVSEAGGRKFKQIADQCQRDHGGTLRCSRDKAHSLAFQTREGRSAFQQWKTGVAA